MTDIAPESMREMAANLDADHRDMMKWLGAKPDAAKSTSSLAAAMLRSIAAEREADDAHRAAYVMDCLNAIGAE